MQARASARVKYDCIYTCGCDILPEELEGFDALKQTMHFNTAGHVSLKKCSRCSVILPPIHMSYHRKYKCDDEKASKSYGRDVRRKLE